MQKVHAIKLTGEHMENMAASLSFFSALVNCKRNLLQVIVSLVLYALASKKTIFIFYI